MSFRFKVLQFNMQFGQIWSEYYPDHAPIRLPATIQEIQSHKADLVMLQEVEKAQPGGLQADVPPNYTELRQTLSGYDSFFSYPNINAQELPFGIGQAIFSKTSLRDTLRLDLPSPSIEFDFRGETRTPTDRLLIGATTNLGGHEVRLLNTHLLAFFMLNANEENQGQRELVLEQLNVSRSIPTLLCGDFNVRKHMHLVEQFATAGFRTVQTEDPTWRRRPFVLDHIFYNDWLRPVRHEVKPTPASDHHVLFAEFEFTR
jgi:endonuclease/exonuclease/phosphatase family metal-dependent hydrolase